MPRSKEELRAQMVVEAEAAIEELLEQIGDREDITLSDIERSLLTVTQQIQQGLTEKLVQAQAEGQDGQDTICPECGQKMRYKGQKRKRVITETGEVTLERAHYYCEPCGKGFFPPG